MGRSTHLFLTAVAFAVVAALLLIPGTVAAVRADTSTVSGTSPGVVKWRFQVSGQYVLQRPAVGPDGGVVVASSSGDVYSLTAQGVLRWIVRSVGGEGGPSIGPDGTTYVASGNRITAIGPTGSIRWTYTEPSAGQGVIAGPTVGPDGNIYVISDYGGLGAFALSPTGQLLWSNPGSPTFSEYGQVGAEVVFSSAGLFAAFDEVGVASSTMFHLSLGGTQEWARPLGGSDDVFMQQQRQPATGADGSLYLTAMGGANGWGLRRVDPNTGDVLWNYSPWPANGMSPPSVGSNGSVYFSRSLAYLDSVTSNGQLRWTFFDGSIIDHPAVSPDGSIVVAGDRPNFGEPGSLRGWNASTGALKWQVNLPSENGGYQIVYTQPRFSADSRTAYVGTAVLGGGDQYSYLYAVDARGRSPLPIFGSRVGPRSPVHFTAGS
jgi:outer membrane protein assembly factor BamB